MAQNENTTNSMDGIKADIEDNLFLNGEGYDLFRSLTFFGV